MYSLTWHPHSITFFGNCQCFCKIKEEHEHLGSYSFCRYVNCVDSIYSRAARIRYAFAFAQARYDINPRSRSEHIERVSAISRACAASIISKIRDSGFISMRDAPKGASRTKKPPPSRVVGQSEPCSSGRCPRDGFTAPNVRYAVETSQSIHALGRSANHRLP